MNPGDPLAQLHPLREPAAVGWWPPAPGWWVLVVLASGLLAGLALLWWRRRQRNRYRLLGLRELQRIEADFTAGADARRCLWEVNALLKQVALHAYPRRDVAALHGSDWEHFLGDTAGERDLFANATTAHYRGTVEPDAARRLCRAAALWIKRHRVSP